MYVHSEGRNGPFRDGVAIGVGARWAEGSVKSEATVSSTFGDRLIDAARANDSLLCVGLDPVRSRFPGPLDEEPDVTRAIVELQRRCHRGHIRSRLRLQTEPGLLSRLWRGRRRRAGRDTAPHSRAHSDHPRRQSRRHRQHRRGVCYRLLRHLGLRCRHRQPLSRAKTRWLPSSSRRDRGVIVVCKTSNPGSADLQNLTLDANSGQQPLYLTVADRVAGWAERWPATLGLVVGATYPAELAEVRRRCPDAPILLPGIGAQAGDLEASLRAGLDSRGLGLIVSSSRSVIYAGNDDGGDWTAAVRAAALRPSRDHQRRSDCPSLRNVPCRRVTRLVQATLPLITRSTARVR